MSVEVAAATPDGIAWHAVQGLEQRFSDDCSGRQMLR